MPMSMDCRAGAEKERAGLPAHGEEGGEDLARAWRAPFGECLADDVKVGKLTPFPRSAKLKPGETVFFSWIVYKSRADRS